MKIDGSCHCSYIRVEGDADPEKTTVCHCTDCQVGNGSAFRVNVPVPGATFRITGQPATYMSFPKIRSGRIRAVRENQTIIQCDGCNHLPAWNIYRRSAQVAAPA